MSERFVVIIEIDGNGGNRYHIITEVQHAAWRKSLGDGTSGQDRESYSDDQDRDCYGADDVDDLAMVREVGREFTAWTAAVEFMAVSGGVIADVIAMREAGTEWKS